MKLAEFGSRWRQIVERLDVIERTVKRDVAKIKPYQERKFRHQFRLLQRESDEKFEAELSGKTPLEQLKILSRKMSERSKVLKMREHYHHQIYINIDLDKTDNGYPEIRIWPKNTNATYRMPNSKHQIREEQESVAFPKHDYKPKQQIADARACL
jgi:hypothetical protein